MLGLPSLLRTRGHFLIQLENKHQSLVRCYTQPTNGRQKLIILGTGWGSYSVLRNIDKKKFDVIVVSPRNHFLFTPLLCSTTVGTLEFRSIIEPIRNSGFRQTDHYHVSRAAGIDFKHKILKVQSVLKPDSFYDLSYDKLVIGVGAFSNTFNTPGVEENAFFLKEVADARKIRNRILTNFELATQPTLSKEESQRLLHIVIVGGGPTGVEFGAEIYDFVEQIFELATQPTLSKEESQQLLHIVIVGGGPTGVEFGAEIYDFMEQNFELATQPTLSKEESQRLLHIVIVGGGPTGVEFGAEIYDFVEQDVARLYKHKREDVRVTLVESNQILASFDQKLRDYAEKKIKQRKGFTLEQDFVTAVHADHVHLKSGKKIPCGIVVWSTGLAPRQFVKDLDIPKNSRGQILTDRQLKILGDESGDIFAIGDCADIKEYPLPCTAQVAEREGKFVADLLNQPSDKVFEFNSAGMLAYIGKYEGLSDLPDVKLQGFPSFFLWRSAYLTKLGSWRLRMQVPLDWTKTLLFGRDVSRFE